MRKLTMIVKNIIKGHLMDKFGVKDFNHISQVSYYIDATEADNHAVREAACACIAELALKIATDAVRAHVSDLLHALTVCFNDDSWPVRDGEDIIIISCTEGITTLCSRPDKISSYIVPFGTIFIFHFVKNSLIGLPSLPFMLILLPHISRFFSLPCQMP